VIDLDALNPEQREATTSYQGSTMILAGAGTGKTRVITSRIAYMLNSGVDPSNVAAMTFTNKAAKEMRERIRPLVGVERAKKLSISTFHSFCLQIIRAHPKKIGVEKGFTLIGTSDQLDLVRRALEEKGWNGLYKNDDILYQIGICKNWLITPEELRNGKIPPGDIPDPALIAECYELYERQLVLNRAIDFDDCIFKVVKALENDEQLRGRLQEKYKYILVDEFQDTNFSQFAILENISAKGGNICVVGDDDQSIYSWRGAMYETLEKFKDIFQPKVVKLEQNYRCTNVVLHAANTLIKNNTIRMEKTLWSQSKSDIPIDIVPKEDAVEEARWVADKCISLIGSGKTPHDISILYRANAQAKMIEMALREAALPYKTFGGQSFFERKEIKDFLSYLRLVGNSKDNMALWRVINTPSRGIGLRTQEKLEALAQEVKKSPYEVMEDETLTSTLGEREKQAIKKFVDKIQKLKSREINQPKEFELLGEAICNEFKLVDHIKQTTKNVMAKQAKVEALKSLPRWLNKSAEDMIADEGALEATRLIDRLTLTETPVESQEEENPNYISLMTIHSSKGLEFPVVFLVGVEDGLIPHKNSIESISGISEERRLLYVAMTRAKEKLIMSYAHMRQTGYQKEIRKASRFLNELPKEGINAPSFEDHQREQAVSEVKRKKSTISKLSSIRSSLKSGDW
jgi:DNA helicase II / ATP-dependent DNA helicase PcrA